MDATTTATVRRVLGQIKRTHWVSGYKATDAEALGILLAHYAEWNGLVILKAAESALEDANFHTEAGLVAEMAAKYELPDPDALIDSATRSALFASLAEVYPGIGKDRDRRLAKLNLLAGRPADNQITSLSDRYNDMTNGDARRVFDMLNEIKEAS
jgi:hypothetical protein